jgi:lambda repressor-like predicted transcriptional regulator
MKHGTWYSYSTKKCRCQVCRDGGRIRAKQYRLDKIRGVVHLVDAQPLRDHVELLRASGMSFRAIALACGWSSRNALADALRRPRVRPATLQRVLAVRPITDQRGDRYVDATGSRRRLQALSYLGHPARVIAAELGRLDRKTYLHIQSGRNRTIRARTADDIRRLYDRLWQVDGISERTRQHARRMGYVPPLAWDDDTIDDPAAKPAEWQRTGRQSLVAEDLAELLDMGETVAAIAARFNVSSDAVNQAMSRYRNRQEAS